MVISFGAPFHVSAKFRHSLEVLCDQVAALRKSGSNSPNDAGEGSDLLPDLIARTTDHLAALSGDQRFTAMTWMKEGETLQCVIPTLSPALIAWLVRTVLNEIGKRSEVLSQHDCEQFVDFLTTKARPYLPPGTNASSLIQSAAERRIPFKIFDRKLIILGYGSGTHILNSSLTDDESINAVSMAKDKVTTNQFQSLSGFPVAKQAIVTGAKEALNFAQKNGYPIVLKPRAEEQGRGVYTFLNSAQEVSSTYEVLKTNYKRIIAEKHYLGDGYRVYVLDGQVVRVRKLSARMSLATVSKRLVNLLSAITPTQNEVLLMRQSNKLWLAMMSCLCSASSLNHCRRSQLKTRRYCFLLLRILVGAARQRTI